MYCIVLYLYVGCSMFIFSVCISVYVCETKQTEKKRKQTEEKIKTKKKDFGGLRNETCVILRVSYAFSLCLNRICVEIRQRRMKSQWMRGELWKGQKFYNVRESRATNKKQQNENYK